MSSAATVSGEATLSGAVTWQVQTAKQRFSEVLRRAQAGKPQVITKHGTPVAVVIDIDEYRRTHEEPQSLSQFLLTWSEELGFEEGEFPLPERRVDPERILDLLAEDEDE
jgi:prevent-host-death family protein